MIEQARISELTELVIELDKILDETDARAFCRLCPEFKEVFLKEMKEKSGCENFVRLCEFMINN